MNPGHTVPPPHEGLAETKLADCGTVGGFAALAERRDSALILLAEDAIIHNQKTRPAQQRIHRVRPTGQHVEPESSAAQYPDPDI